MKKEIFTLLQQTITFSGGEFENKLRVPICNSVER